VNECVYECEKGFKVYVWWMWTNGR